METNVILHLSKIDELKNRLAELEQKVEMKNEQKQQLCSENKTLESEVNSRQLRLSELTAQAKALKEIGQSLESSNEKDSAAFCELNDKVEAKRARLSQIEVVNKKMKRLIELRDSKLNEIDSVTKACDALHKEQHVLKLDRFNALKDRTKELEQRKANMAEKRNEIKKLIAEAKVKSNTVILALRNGIVLCMQKELEDEEAKRTVAETSLQETIHEV